MSHQNRIDTEITPIDCAEIEAIIKETRKNYKRYDFNGNVGLVTFFALSLPFVVYENWWGFVALWALAVAIGVYYGWGEADTSRLSDAQVSALANVTYLNTKALKEMQERLRSRGHLRLDDVDNLISAEKGTRYMRAQLETPGAQQLLVKQS